MSIASATLAGRRAAEAAMVDKFTAYEPSGRTPNADGMEARGFTAKGSTKGKIQSRARQGDTNARTVRIGDVDRPVLEGGLHIPVTAPVPVAGPPGVGWEYECTSVGPGSDRSLLGRRWLVVDVPAKTYATARRLDVVELP